METNHTSPILVVKPYSGPTPHQDHPAVCVVSPVPSNPMEQTAKEVGV